ncbi:hypothetical protein [uncultured Halovibrio sp.]|uniref:hypothetical protein n=1 Tax=uncultured Halovibrio sp. TaxID=985049 RepID=UPI0025D3300E|nr:hypothetical protein [uncultured Halovibrio sp.]
MKVDQEVLASAEREGILGPGQAERLWGFLAEGQAAAGERPQFRAAHLLYYFGGLLAIGAASLFLNAAWNQFGPWMGAALAIGYAIGCWHVAAWLLEQRRLAIWRGRCKQGGRVTRRGRCPNANQERKESPEQ